MTDRTRKVKKVKESKRTPQFLATGRRCHSLRWRHMNSDTNQFQRGNLESEAAVKQSASSGKLAKSQSSRALSLREKPTNESTIRTKGSECNKQGGNREPRRRANAQVSGDL